MHREERRLRRRDDAQARERLLASVDLRARRAQRIATLDLEVPAALPMAAESDRILARLEAAPVIVVAGETGSGKTTQLPKLCLRFGLGEAAMIGHTQPRRIAARAVARRIAHEMGAEPGREVVHAVRFSDQTGPETLVKVMTDGLLLNEIRRDKHLDAYDAIIVDEAHERSLNIDFLLGYLKRLSRRRKDLKIIITSATIDVERIADFFDDAPIVRVGGRSHPVEVRYLGGADEPVEQIAEVLEDIDTDPDLRRRSARDVLVFFASEREILAASKSLRQRLEERYEVLPLYGRLSNDEQQRIFGASSRRRVVLSTNVAETSLTVPNIGFVIDVGLARVNRYSYRSKLQRLPIEPISKASAEQRKGRCGRIAPGVCFRLYDASDFESRPDFTDPEIRRVNLAGVVLQMMSLKLGSIGSFPFVDPPDPRAVRDAHALLNELRALEGDRLTDTGRMLARMPIDPRLARMLVEAHRQGALSELLVIVAGLAVPDPRERPVDKKGSADRAHEEFADERSDFLAYLNLWRWLTQTSADLTRRRFDRALKARFLSPQRVHEWRETHRQLRSVCRDLGLQEKYRAGQLSGDSRSRRRRQPESAGATR